MSKTVRLLTSAAFALALSAVAAPTALTGSVLAGDGIGWDSAPLSVSASATANPAANGIGWD